MATESFSDLYSASDPPPPSHIRFIGRFRSSPGSRTPGSQTPAVKTAHNPYGFVFIDDRLPAHSQVSQTFCLTQTVRRMHFSETFFSRNRLTVNQQPDRSDNQTVFGQQLMTANAVFMTLCLKTEYFFTFSIRSFKRYGDKSVFVQNSRTILVNVAMSDSRAELFRTTVLQW